MNEEAFNDLYQEFLDTGYRGTKEDFKSLMSTNPDAFNDGYTSFTETGYKGSREDFSTLLGLSLPSTKDVEVKKKGTSELPSEDGSLGLQKFDPEKFKSLSDQPIVGRDINEEGYHDPVSMLGMYPDNREDLDRAMQQRMADRKLTSELSSQQEVVLQDIKEKEDISNEEIRLRNEKERQDLLQSPDFEIALKATDSEAMKLTEEKATGYFNDLYGKYGFIFKEVGMGDALEVVAPDGSTEEIDLQTFFSNESEASKLRSFVSAKANKPQEPINLSEQDEINRAAKVREMRKSSRINKDGSESTVLFQSANIDGKNVVYPTLFPKSDSDNYGSHPLWWQEKEGMDAYDYALKRGEVFEFDTEEEAQDFAEGSWKEVNTLDAEANKFYKDRNLDYNTYRNKFNRYEEIKETIQFLEEGPNSAKNLTAEEKERFSSFYVNGRRRYDTDKLVEELNAEADVLRETVNSSEFRDVREDFDLYLEKGFTKKAKEAAAINLEARQLEDDIQYQSLNTFGVRAEDLNKIVPKNDNDAYVINKLNLEYQNAKAVSQQAADKYEVANTWLDAKADKNAKTNFVENWSATTNAWESGLANGKVGNEVLKIALGLTDIEDDASTEDVAAEIIKYLQEGDTGKTSRVEYRWHQAKGFKEAYDVFKDDPAELASAFVAQSMSQMLPYGWKIISGSVATGAGTGAVVGSVAPGAGTAAGAITGAGYGLRTGFAATSVALEYTNAVLDAARENYDVMNPEQLVLALQDEEVWAKGKEIGLKRGLTIGVVDMLSGGLAGRVFKTGKLSSRATKLASGIGERMVFDPLMEGAGEALAMKVAGQELSGKDIFAEALGGFGNNTPTAAFNMYLDGRASNNLDIANSLTDLRTISKEGASDSKITSWANNMEKLGQISSEQNQRIQENVGLRREARDILNVGNKGNVFGPTTNAATEARLMELLSAREELTSTPNRQSVFASKVAEINAEITEIATTKKLRPAEQQTLLAGQGVLPAQEQEGATDIRGGIKKYAINGKSLTKEEFIAELDAMTPRRFMKSSITVDNDEETSNILNKKFDAIQKPSTEGVDAQEQAGDSSPVGTGVLIPGETTTEVTQEELTEPEGAIEETQIEGTEVETEEVSSKTQEEQEFLDQEVQDIESMFSQEEGPQFQLDSKETSPEKKTELVETATKLMEKVQPELSETTITVEESDAKVYPVVVKENTELANKVQKMGLKDIVGKKVNFVMADQLKVDENRMGGPFFPLQEGLFGEIAWASISESAARSIAKGSIGADFSVVYNMSPAAVDSNLVLLDTLIEKVKNSANSETLFNAMMADIQGKKFGPKTDFVHKIAAEANTIEEFSEGFAQLDVDTKAAIFKSVLPSSKVEASTEVGRLFAQEGITQESVRAENIEQFVSDLPMGAMTMVLQITDKQGNPITNETINEAIVTPEEQKQRGIKEHRNYPYYLRGKAVGMMEETVPFWNVSKSALSTINAKVSGVVKDSKGKAYSAAQARSAEMRRASMQASKKVTLTEPTATAYERFVKRLSKAFPNVEVVATQEQFDSLLADTNAKGLSNKNQKVYGAVYQGKLYLNPALENFNTPVHEFGHIWSNVAKTLNPEAYNRGIELIQDSDYIAQVENNPEYKRVIKQMKKDGATDEEIRQYIQEEALATAIGDKGESFATAAQKKNFRNWLNELFDFVKKLTGISNVSAEQLKDMNLDEFLQGVVVDLMSENELFAEAEVNGLSESLQLMTTPSNASVTEIVNLSRQRGFSDAAIRAVLKGRGFSANDINTAMEVNIDLLTPLPREFGNVEGGVVEGKKLFTDVREALNRFSTEGPRGGRGTTRTKTFSEIRAKGMELLKANPIFQAQPEQTQMELLSAFDRTLQIRSNTNVQREISAIRNNLKQRKIGVKNLRNAQIELRNFIRKNLPKSGIYSQGQINRLISAVSNIKNEAEFEAQAEKVLKIVEEQRAKIKRSVLKDMVELVSKKAKTAKTQSGKRRGKGLDAVGQSFFQSIKDVIRAAASNDQELLEKIANSIDEAEVEELINSVMNGETLTTKERATLDRALAYDTFAELSTMELEDVQALYQDLKNTRAESIARLKSRRLIRAEESAALQAEVEGEIKEGYGILFNEDGTLKNDTQLKNEKEAIWKSFKDLKVWDGIKKWAERYDFSTVTGAFDYFRNNLAHLGTLTNLLDKKGKFFTNNVYRALNRMNEVHLQGYYEQTSQLDSMANSIEGITEGYKQFKNETTDDVIELDGITDTKTGNAWTQPLNYDQAMRIYALSKNQVQRDKLIKMGFDADNMAKIVEFIGPRGVQMSDMMVDYFSNSYFESVNSVYRQVNDVNLGYVENYFPTQTIAVNVDAKLLTDGDFSGVFNAETAPALKERTDKKSDVALGIGFTDVVESHLQTMEKYKAYAEGVQRINGIFRSPAIKALLGRNGTDLSSAVRNAINYAVNPDAGAKTKQTVLEKAMTRFTGYALSFKAVQILKQATSFVQAFEDYSYRGVGEKKIPGLDLVMFMMDGAKTIATLPKQIRTAQEVSATFRDRLSKGLEGDVYGLETGSPTFKPLGRQNNMLGRAKRALKKAAGYPTVIGDVLGVMGYMINYNRNIANGMSKAEAVEAFNNYNSTQQTRRATEKIPLQMSQDVLKRAFTMFGSTIYLQMNKVSQSYKNIGRTLSDGKMPSAKDTRALALNLSVANVMFISAANIAKFIDGDDEDKEMALKQMKDAAMGLNLVYQIPLVGGGVEVAIKRATGDRTPTSDVVNPYISVFNKVWKGAKEDDVIKATQPVVEMVLGTQLDPFIGLFNTFGSLEFEEENVYDMLGVSKSYRPGYGQTKSKKSSKNKKGMTKTELKKFMPELYKEIYSEPDASAKEIRAEKRKLLNEIKQDAYGDLE